MYKVKLKEDTDNKYRDCWLLLISADDGTNEYSDNGEPEDNLFIRDYKWITSELHRAYKQGLMDGRGE